MKQEIESVTIIIFVEPDSLRFFIEQLKIIDGLPDDNNYTFRPNDIKFSQAMISNYIWVNIPVLLWSKFVAKYMELGRSITK